MKPQISSRSSNNSQTNNKIISGGGNVAEGALISVRTKDRADFTSLAQIKDDIDWGIGQDFKRTSSVIQGHSSYLVQRQT